MMVQKGWHRVSRREPCPVCECVDNCTVSDDGGAVWCGRIQNGSIRQNAGGQFLHILHSTNPPQDYEHPSHRRDRERMQKSDSTPQSKTDWAKLMKFASERPDIAEKRDELAQQLGVRREALDRLEIGWSEQNPAWLIPERDAAGNVIGIVRRYRNGQKRQWPGGRRGLTFALNWQLDSGPVLLVEGASDVAALLSIGMCVIGRPSNSGGVALLIELLCRLPLERRIVVVGENDRKRHEDLKPSVRDRHSPDCEACSLCWPGHFGAFSAARQLSESLLRPVDVAFPPLNAKDVREMVRQTEGVS
jgi:DNA-binding XRE family transcriptional regulator